MNEFLIGLGRRWTDVAGERGITIAPPELDPAVAEEILQLARVVAHARERSFAPLASYLAGVAAERFRAAQGADPAALAAFIRQVRVALERDLGA